MQHLSRLPATDDEVFHGCDTQAEEVSVEYEDGTEEHTLLRSRWLNLAPRAAEEEDDDDDEDDVEQELPWRTQAPRQVPC